jgi:predicted RNase H-like HicB family nuclease
MKGKFTVILTREGAEYVARCQEMADAVASGSSKEEALERIKVVIRKMLEGGSEGGSAPLPNPVSPPPRKPPGPIVRRTEINEHGGDQP